MLDKPPPAVSKLFAWQPPDTKTKGIEEMPLETIRVERVSPSGMLRLSGLHEERLFMGYTLRDAKRAYRLEYRQKRLGTKPAEFHTAKGELTAYAFACGYVERIGEFRLYLDGVYHLQNDSGFWATFSTLTEARQTARRLIKGVTKNYSSPCCKSLVLWLPCSGCEIEESHDFASCQKCGGDIA